ncbi:hypothetical protein XENOCAPTIV_000742 [Xenoophorus captivus]|uniref:Dynein heavy chain tail domain-containing protein n=1 Tax=Xenoophorus captivus TaxID=1517983 RepID=A0ABV0S1H3_9TELE
MKTLDQFVVDTSIPCVVVFMHRSNGLQVDYKTPLPAESNLTFLSLLKNPCEELSQLKPRQIASKLRHIVVAIRTIWNNSPHYNSSERITGLFCQLLDEIVRKNFFDWTQNLDGQYLKKLQQPLLVRCKNAPFRVDINFDKIVGMLSPDELGLFRQRVRFIDRKMEPGMTKLLWLSHGASNHFINDCLLHVDKLSGSFKFPSPPFTRNLEFEDDQESHQQSRLQTLRSTHLEIVHIMTQIHSIFAKDGAEVQEHWVAYTEKVDRIVEEAFRCNIRDSMKKLCTAITGDNKTSPNPLFKVLVEETVFTIQFVMLDCSPLKSSLVQDCGVWQKMLKQLLSQMASSCLQELYASMQNNADRLMKPPQTLDELSDSLTLLENLKGDLANNEAQITLIHERFAILDKYEVPVESTVQAMREALNEKWVWFQQVLIHSDDRQQKDKEKFKNNLFLSFEELKNKVDAAAQEFSIKGPFQSTLRSDLALRQIEEHRVQLEALKQEQNDIFSGLAFFRIKQPPCKMIWTMEKV